jgi:hypothetical protein
LTYDEDLTNKPLESKEDRMRSLALALTLSATFAQAQEQPPAAAPAPAAPATVEQTASPELVGQLVKDLSITPTQAQGAAGALFGVAKTKLPAGDFARLAGAVPNMDGLLRAAPTGDVQGTSLEALAIKAALTQGGMGAAAAAAGPISKLGIKPDAIARLIPTLTKAVESKGGAEVAALLTSALK